MRVRALDAIVGSVLIRDAIDRAVTARASSAVSELRVRPSDMLDSVIIPLAPFAGQVADFVTTAAALDRGGVELNPLMRPVVRNLPLFAALKLGLGATAAVAVRRLQGRGKHRTARILSALTFAAGAGPALNNIIALRGMD